MKKEQIRSLSLVKKKTTTKFPYTGSFIKTLPYPPPPQKNKIHNYVVDYDLGTN